MVGEDNGNRNKIGSCSTKKAKEVAKTKPEHVMNVIDGNTEGYLGQDVLGELPPVIGVTKVDLLGLYKFVDNLGGYMNVSFNNKWNEIAKLLGMTQENQDAIKECYKEYIGMAKIYYEEVKRTKQEKPGDVVGKGSGTAGLKRPQAVADVIAEIGDSLDGTQGRIAQDDIKVEGSNSVWTTDNNGEEYTSSSDGFNVII
nr:bulb-type lectin domain-containing protein [Tanacetum cinerariifolium]